MPDKLTDEEIKKALECCADGSGTGLIKATLDLINRLQIELQAMRNAANGFKAENERLKKAKYIVSTVDYCADDLDKALKENEELKSAINSFRGYEDKIKAEAYKECIEKVMLNSRCNPNEMTYTISRIAIDNLLKELVGDTNESKA
ncbi:MAG: hypothetical protein U0M06_03200 [Clostridia bacterium]|nr:hypothetical protein [Clostridia bacterium]